MLMVAISTLQDVGIMRRLAYHIESKKLYAYEREVMNKFDLSILVSSRDSDHLTEKQNAKVSVYPNGVSLEDYPFEERFNSAPVIVFIGNMSSVQNMDACIFFAKDVMPEINKHIDAKFRVVGKIDVQKANILKGYENVEVTGPVNSISNAVADARLAVCPVRMAAGIQNKVLEYMSLGLPVITSSRGLEGINAVPDRDVLVADSPEQYVSCVEHLWEEDSRRRKYAVNGYEYVKANHDWQKVMCPLVDEVLDLVVERRM